MLNTHREKERKENTFSHVSIMNSSLLLLLLLFEEIRKRKENDVLAFFSMHAVALHGKKWIYHENCRKCGTRIKYMKIQRKMQTMSLLPVALFFFFKKKHWNRLSCQMEMPLNENSLRFAQKQIHYIPFAIAYACHSECFKNCNYISELLLLLNALRIESIKV